MEQTIKGKVTEVAFNREFKPAGKQFIIYYFNIKVDDGYDVLNGEFSTNSKNQTKFLVGETYEMNLTVKQGRQGEYNWFEYSEAEKEKRKSTHSGSGYSGGKKEPWSPYVRSRKEAITIITQSSYEAAVLVCNKLAKETIKSHSDVAKIAKKLTEFIVDASGLNTTESKNGDKAALKAANEKSIIYQKAIKIAIESLDMTSFEETLGPRSTQWIISVSELIVEDMMTIIDKV